MANKNKLLDISVDTNKLRKLGRKLEKYGPYAIQQGLKATSEFLNSDEFKMSMEPEDQSGSPFQFSSYKQQQAFFASDGFGGGIPHVRTHELMRQGVFTIDDDKLWIEYMNEPYSKFVFEPPYQIIGHKKRGWQSPSVYVARSSKVILHKFREAVKKAWEEMERFMFGGGGGL